MHTVVLVGLKLLQCLDAVAFLQHFGMLLNVLPYRLGIKYRVVVYLLVTVVAQSHLVLVTVFASDAPWQYVVELHLVDGQFPTATGALTLLTLKNTILEVSPSCGVFVSVSSRAKRFHLQICQVKPTAEDVQAYHVSLFLLFFQSFSSFSASVRSEFAIK